MKQLTCDVVIIGAGPVGLFQVFELGLQGLSSIVVDSLPAIGGQCAQLYPNKPIYDIPAIPAANAIDVIRGLEKQAAPFKPQYLLGETIVDVNKVADHKFKLLSDKASSIECKAIVIAAGNGAFEPVKLKVKGIEAFENQQVFYSIDNIEAFRDKDLVILGGGDSALDWALTLHDVAQSVVLIHRNDRFRAASASVARMRSLCDELKMQFLMGQVVGFDSQNNKLSQLIVQSAGGIKRRLDVDNLLVFFGLSPKPGPISQWNLNMHHNSIEVDTQKFQSSVKGIYAVGDINTYPGKRKLILSGFHEAALAAYDIKQSLDLNARVTTQYTTNSTLLHKRMGLVDEAAT